MTLSKLPNDHATRVLLPKRIWEQRNTSSEKDFIALVKSYLVRYENYQLISTENGYAICERGEVAKKEKKRGKS